MERGGTVGAPPVAVCVSVVTGLVTPLAHCSQVGRGCRRQRTHGWGTLDSMAGEVRPGDEDTRVWIGQVKPGYETDQAAFVAWLNSDKARDIFRRKRLTEYTLVEEDGTVTVVFKAPHTGDPRIMIDFLRYPGMWPEFWEFRQGGRAEDLDLADTAKGAVRVHWRREEAARPSPTEPGG